MKNRWSHLEQGDTLMGSFISTGYPVNTELMGLAGFDFLIIDLEHGIGSERDILSQCHSPQRLLRCVPAGPGAHGRRGVRNRNP